MEKKIVILGGGLAGVSLAYFLKNKNFLLFEKEKELGGLCRTKRKNNFLFDFCGHVLHFKYKEIFYLIRKLLGKDLLRHKRNSVVYCFKRFIPYPFQVNLYNLPFKITKGCFSDFVKIYFDGKKEPSNFLEWCYKNFGKSITDHFMRPYNEKFWTYPLEKLNWEWAEKVIIVPTLNQLLEGTLKENKKNLGYNSFFWYPKKGGIDNLIKAFLLHIDSKKIFKECEVVKIDPILKRVEFKNGLKEKYDVLISTLPLPELPKILNFPSFILKFFKKLKWISIFNLNLGVKEKSKQWHWIYFPEKEFSFYRVGFFNNFFQNSFYTSLYTEVSYSQNKPIDKRKIVAKIIKDLLKIGIIEKKENIKEIVINDIKYAYPVYDLDWKEAREKILNYLKKYRIFCIGRFGNWKYMSMEDVILESLKFSKFINENF